MPEGPIELNPPPARVFAFYLPQFHPVAENDTWWGRGFTEWTNVAKARPLFRGHSQPRLPADLGFYDLRVPEVRDAQAELARNSGVEGFCYWHYWFGNGRRILERPFQEVLDSRKPDFPFSLAWANHSWTGIWTGSPENTLLEQKYPGRDDERAHFNWARQAFEDPRYQLVDGKPVFVIFAPHEMPSATDFMDHWRELAHQAGYPGMYFVAMSHNKGLNQAPFDDPHLAGFDAVTPLIPKDFYNKLPTTISFRVMKRLRTRNLGPRLAKWGGNRIKLPARYRYADLVAQALRGVPDDTRLLPNVLPGWDNTPRTGRNGVVFEGTTPKLFAQHLSDAVAWVQSRPPQHRIVFLKAWNEWAEGNYVEPDALHGHAFLDAMRGVLLPGSPVAPAAAAIR